MWGRTWNERLLDVLLPRTCVACREDLPPPLSGPLCGVCLASLRPLGAPLRRQGLVWLEAVDAAYRYRHPVPALIHAFKYRSRRSVGRALGAWMAGLWRRQTRLRRPAALVPVPLHPARRRQRGFNQARLLADEVARSARIPVCDALIRIRNTGPQVRHSRISRTRRLNGAFRLRPGADVAGLRLVLIDDVITTGGTLEACARELIDGGAEEVRAYVLARGGFTRNRKNASTTAETCSRTPFWRDFFLPVRRSAAK